MWIELENGADSWRGTLPAFLAANRDGLDWIECEAIRETLSRGATYVGGGGAAPVWIVRRLE